MPEIRIVTIDFVEATRRMIGLSLSDTWRGHGSAVFLEIGTLIKEPGRNHPRGEFSVMLDCSWRIERPRSILVGSFDSYRRIEGQLKRLEGSHVSEVAVYGVLPEITVSLDSKVRILSFETYESQPAWSLRLPDGRWIGSRNGRIVQKMAEQIVPPDRR